MRAALMCRVSPLETRVLTRSAVRLHSDDLPHPYSAARMKARSASERGSTVSHDVHGLLERQNWPVDFFCLD
jgi:hypothetical protein